MLWLENGTANEKRREGENGGPAEGATGVKMFVPLTLTGGDFEKTTEVVGISICRWRAGERDREGGRETSAERR